MKKEEKDKCHCGCEDEIKTEEKCECEECDCGEDCDCGEECDCEDCDCEDSDCEECDCESKDLKIKELEDSLLRSKAEFINYRKRLEEEHFRLANFCNEDLIKQILPIIDNFERAINMDDADLSDEVSKFLSGFKMIYCNLTTILKENGVVEIDGNNKPFNPSYHEAIMTEERSGVVAGMVLDVLQKGYILKGKVIRPAMVRVSE